MRTRRLALVVGLVASALLAGCAPASAPSPTDTPVATAEPTPAPTPEWTVAYGASCDAVLTPEQRAELIGPATIEAREWFLQTQTEQYPLTHAPIAPPGPAGTAGGLRCTWIVDPGSRWDSTRVNVLALPLAQTDPATVSALSEPRCDWNYDVKVCRVGVTAGDSWLMASISDPYLETDAPVPADFLTSIADAAAANGAAYPTGVPRPATPEVWPILSCEDLAARMNLAEVLGADLGSGFWEGSRQFEQDLLEYAGVEQWCQFWTGDSGVDGNHYILSVRTEPGGAWQWDEIAADGGDPVEVRGAVAALRTLSPLSEPDPIVSTRVTDGVNYLTVTGSSSILIDVTERALAALSDR